MLFAAALLLGRGVLSGQPSAACCKMYSKRGARVDIVAAFAGLWCECVRV